MKFSFKKIAKRFGIAAFLFFFIKGLIWLAIFFGAARLLFPGPAKEAENAQVTIWEALPAEGKVHPSPFRIIVPQDLRDTSLIGQYGRNHLLSKGQKAPVFHIRACDTCELNVSSRHLAESLKEKGHYIVEP